MNKSQMTDKIAQFVSTQPEDLSYKQFKLAVWYIKHKVLLQKIGIGVLSVWCVLLVGYSFLGWVKYFIVDYNKDKNLLARGAVEFSNYAAKHISYGAQPLQVEETRIFPELAGKYDFVTKVINTNDRWLAQVSYKYIYDNGETKLVTVTVLPGSEQLLAVFGQEVKDFAGQANLAIGKIAWKKISSHRVKSVENFMTDRLVFVPEDFIFPPAGQDGLAFGRLEFKLKNNSAVSSQPISLETS